MSLFLPLLLRRSRGFLLALLLAVITLAAGVALLGVSGWFLTGAAITTAAMTFNLFSPSALVRGFSFVRILSRYGERLSGHAATLSMLSDLRAWLFGRLIPLMPQRGLRDRTGDFVARLTADVDTLDMVMLQAILPIGTALLGAAGLTLLLWLSLPEAIPVTLSGFLATALLVPLFLAISGRRVGARAVQASADVRIAALDGIDGHADWVALGATGDIERSFGTAAQTLRTARLGQARRVAFGPAFAQLGAGATLVGTLWFGLSAIEGGRITGPVMVGVLLATLAIFEVTGPVLRGAGRLGSAWAAARRIRSLVEGQPPVRDALTPARLPEDGTLVLDHVRYGFSHDRMVLADLSLTIGIGERIAILGESGSGKSTLLSLIVRLADVEGGSIRLAGLDIRDVAQADLHGHVALLTQDAPVFIGTIRDNLKIGSPFANDATLFTALGNARLDEFVRCLPLGLDTWLGESGATLSAGQARRLCLARTLLSPARILLLDEPTAGLDPDVEAEFLGDLLVATEGRTLVLATHAALPEGAVDRIYRLRRGRLSLD